MPTETLNPIRRVLYATDFSPACAAAVEYAERLAACTGASLLVLHAQPGWRVTSPSGKADDETTQTLAKIQPRASDVQVEHLVYGGSPGEVICWVAQERDCDQIVMGTHGRTGLSRLLMGSVAEHVIRHARCPVLTVRLRPETEEPLKQTERGTLMPAIRQLSADRSMVLKNE